MKVLIDCKGFIGDILFSTSVAQKLRQEYDIETLDYLIHLYQPYTLVKNNPNIDEVYLFDCDKSKYDKIIPLDYIDFNYPPTEYYQKVCGIKNTSAEYFVNTIDSFDKVVEYTLSPYKKANKKVIAYLNNWEERSFLFTKEQYELGIDVPYLGYGGKHRDVNYIVDKLSENKDLILIPVGMQNGFNARESNFQNTSDYTMLASLIKQCDYFIGAEGGLCNLAAGVGTKTIITGDFVHQLYGWNGTVRKHQEPKLGPKYYFTDPSHITLDPYLKDNEVIDQIFYYITQ